MYQAFAALFIAQAYGIEMSFTNQVALLHGRGLRHRSRRDEL